MEATSSESVPERYAYSPDSDLAAVTPDGRLVVYDTRLATVKSEFSPSSHLSSACTCVAWKPRPQEDAVTKSGKK